MTPLRMAVIGTGHLGKFHTRILSELPQVKLIAVSDVNQETVKQVAEQYNILGTTDYRSLIGKVDAVVLATPTTYHHAIGMELLAAGISLLIEKPLTSSSQQAIELVEAAEKNNCRLAVGHVERFNPAWTKVGSKCDNPKYIHAERLCAHTFRSMDIGVVLDLMIHDLDLVLDLVKQPVRQVEAIGLSLFGKREDIASARITFSGGCVANITASRASYTQTRAMQIWSPTGFSQLDFASKSATVVKPHPAILNRQLDVERLAPDERAHVKDQLFTRYLQKLDLELESVDQLTAEITDFVEAVQEQRTPKVDGKQAADAIEVAEWILQKIETHSWDGVASGPCGPFAMFPTQEFLSGPHWNQSSTKTQDQQDSGSNQHPYPK